MWRELVQLIFPVSCVHCSVRGAVVCDVCMSRLAREACDGRKFGYSYNHPVVRSLVLNLKRRKNMQAAKILIGGVVGAVCKVAGGESGMIVITYVPLSKERLRERGFNQAECLASALARKLRPFVRDAGVRVSVQNMLTRRKSFGKQSKRSKSERLVSVRGSMRARRADPNTTYILVDDVITTGATIHEARRALLASGAKKVYCFAAAYA